MRYQLQNNSSSLPSIDSSSSENKVDDNDDACIIKQMKSFTDDNWIGLYNTIFDSNGHKVRRTKGDHFDDVNSNNNCKDEVVEVEEEIEREVNTISQKAVKEEKEETDDSAGDIDIELGTNINRRGSSSYESEACKEKIYVICFEQFDIGDKLVVSTSSMCKHLFH